MKYKTRETLERFGQIELKVEALASLDETIDLLFEELKRTGEERLLEDLCPYFGKVWPAARGLNEFLGERPASEWEGKRVLEVGCGLALPSMAMALLGAEVTATDFHPEVPAFLEKNLLANGLVGRVKYQSLDWRSLPAAAEPWDWIVGSDILYEKQHVAQVAEALTRLAGPRTRIAVGDPARPYLQSFVDEMKRLGWAADTRVFTVPESSDRPGGAQVVRDVFVLLMDRKA
jgi:predicted nicotinamide N-methyase